MSFCALLERLETIKSLRRAKKVKNRRSKTIQKSNRERRW